MTQLEMFRLNLPTYLECHEYLEAHMYADDTPQDVSGKSIDGIETKLPADLLNSKKWMENNKLTMNLKITSMYAYWYRTEN